MVATIAAVQNSEALLRQILERDDSSAVFRISLDLFDKYLDDIVASARAKREFTHFHNKGDGMIEFYFEKYPERTEWGDSERDKAWLATAGSMSDEEAAELERWLEESRKIPGRVYDWS